jgi:hypothetical protein
MLEMEQIVIAAAAGRREGRECHFMIRDICFWCASVWELADLTNHIDVFLSPVCKGSKVHPIPLASNGLFQS